VTLSWSVSSSAVTESLKAHPQSLLTSPPWSNPGNRPGSQTMPECLFNKYNATSKNKPSSASQSTNPGRLGGAAGLVPPHCVGPGFPLQGWFCPSEPRCTPSRRRAKGRLAQIGSIPVVFFSLALEGWSGRSLCNASPLWFREVGHVVPRPRGRGSGPRTIPGTLVSPKASTIAPITTCTTCTTCYLGPCLINKALVELIQKVSTKDHPQSPSRSHRGAIPQTAPGPKLCLNVASINPTHYQKKFFSNEFLGSQEHWNKPSTALCQNDNLKSAGSGSK